MKFLNDLIQKLYPPYEPLKPGIFSYRPDDTPSSFPYPMHLRIESPEHTQLILNASTVLHLNQTAAEFIYRFMEGDSKNAILKQLSRRYQASKETIEKDYNDLFERLEILMTTPDLDPVTFLDFDRQEPYSGDLTAPYRMDLALTYQFDGQETDGLLVKRVDQELDTNDWKKIIDDAWQNGIPHLVFTGGEPTLRTDLPELIKHAEMNGQVTGLLTNGIKLADAAYTQQILQCGIDHIMLVLQPELETAWKALEILMPDDIFVTVHLTVTSDDIEQFQGYLEHLLSLGVHSISLSASQKTLRESFQAASEIALDMGFSIESDLPVPYSALNSVMLELDDEDRAIRAEGRGWLYVEPDGDVLKAQGLTEVLGNLLTDQWVDIWAKTK